MVFELWTDSTFTTVENGLNLKARGLIEPSATVEWRIDAESWEVAMQAMYTYQGYGTYIPMRDEREDTAR